MSSQSRKRRKDVPNLKVCLEFGKLTSELDLTIVDRLGPLMAMGRTPSRNGAGASLKDEFGQVGIYLSGAYNCPTAFFGLF